jgi:hypothetical protein
MLAAFLHILQRRLAAKDAVRVRKPDPLIGQVLSVESIERFKDTDEIRDPEELVDTQNAAFLTLLHLVIGTVANATQELARIFIADCPLLNDIKKGLKSGTAQAFALAL